VVDINQLRVYWMHT